MIWRWEIQKLGAPIVIYERYRRIEVAAWVLASASGAAIAWWIAERLDGTLWILLPVFPALGLSMLSLNFFLRFLDPGKRVGLYENGITLGWRGILWTELERVSYSLVGVTDEQSHATHQELTITFHLSSGKEPELRLSDETLPFHIDIPEFISLLLELGVPVTDQLAEVEHRDGADPAMRNRSAEVAAELQSAFGEEFSRIDGGEGISGVLKSLVDGSKDRKRLRRGYLLRFLGLKGLEGMMGLVGLGLVFAIVPLAILVLLEIVQLFDESSGNEDILQGFGVPQGWIRLPFLIIAIPAVLKGAKMSWPVGDAFESRARRNRASFSAIRKSRPVTAEALAGSYALYLRSFAGEYFRYLQTTAEQGREGLARKYETLERELDHAVLSASQEHLPLLALANSRDASASPELHALFVPTRDWVKVAAHLMSRSTAVILNLSAATESLLAEIWALDHLGAQAHTFVVIGSEFRLDDLHKQEQQRLEGFPHRAREDAPDLNWKLEQFIKESAA